MVLKYVSEPPQDNFQHYRPMDDIPPPISKFTLYFGRKWDLVITFDWGVLLTQGQRVWPIFCKIFPGTPNSTIFVVPKNAPQIPYLAYLAIFGCVFECAKYGQVKRSCKMQFRCVDLASTGAPSQKLWPNLIFAWFPHCNYNVKQEQIVLEMSARLNLDPGRGD